MYTRFASLDDFIHAVQTDTRTRRELIEAEPLLAWVFLEYRLWKTDNWQQLPFVEDLRRKLEAQATARYRPWPPRNCRNGVIAGRQGRTPSEVDQHLFELFGIDWKTPVQHDQISVA
jgi:hypothetical protein